MLLSKKSGLKGTLRQVFIRVYRLEINSVLLVFRRSFMNYCTSNLLSGSTLPPPPFPVRISKYTLNTYTVRKGGPGRYIHAAKSLYRSILFRWRHFALPSLESYLSTGNWSALRADGKQKGQWKLRWNPGWFDEPSLSNDVVLKSVQLADFCNDLTK